MLDKRKYIRVHFKKVDPVIYKAMKGLDFDSWFVAGRAKRDKLEVYGALCREIIGQQLAGKAAWAISNRFVELLENEVVPEKVLEMEDQKLRDVGMSWAKVKYIKDLSEKTMNDEVKLEKLYRQSDEEVISELTKVKGIGRWTAEMFLIFSLGREDIFSYGDLGLRRGFEYLYGFEKASEEDVREVVDKWSPYKSYGSVTLWHSLDNRV